MYLEVTGAFLQGEGSLVDALGCCEVWGVSEGGYVDVGVGEQIGRGVDELILATCSCPTNGCPRRDLGEL